MNLKTLLALSAFSFTATAGTMELDTNYFEVPPTVKVKPTKAGITNLFGFDGSTTKFLRADGTIAVPPGGGGNVTNTGASVIGMVPVYTDTTGTQITPTNYLASYRTLWVDAGAMIPSSTNGAAPGTLRLVGSDDYVKDVYDFNDTTSQSVEFTTSLPPTWNNGTVKAKIYWVSYSATTGTNVWSFAGGASSAGDTLGAILGTAVTATNAVANATNKVNVVTTGALTLGSTPAADDLILFKLSRLPGDAYDTTTGDARLLGIKIQYIDTLTGGASW